MHNNNVLSHNATAYPVGDANAPLNLFKDVPLNISALNVRTLLQTGQQALLAATLSNLNIDICCLSELRMPESGTCRIKIPGKTDFFTLYYSGEEAQRQGLNGVGIAISKTVNDALMEWNPITARIAKLRLKAKPANITIIAVYAPTNIAADDIKETFYEAIELAIEDTPKNDYLILAGDFNAQLGPPVHDRQETGHNSLGTLTDNGERLLFLASNHHLIVANTLFSHKRRHLQTWISPDGKTRNQIDFILIRKHWRHTLLDARSHWGINIVTDHALVLAKIKVHPICEKRRKPFQKFDITQLKIPEKKTEFVSKYNSSKPQLASYSVDGIWTQIKQSLTTSAKAVLGHTKKKNDDWISTNTISLSSQRKTARNNNNHILAAELARQIKRSAKQDREIFWTLTACLIHEYVMIENTFWGILRTRTKLIEQ